MAVATLILTRMDNHYQLTLNIVKSIMKYKEWIKGTNFKALKTKK